MDGSLSVYERILVRESGKWIALMFSLLRRSSIVAAAIGVTSFSNGLQVLILDFKAKTLKSL
jgi:hypothetical protein